MKKEKTFEKCLTGSKKKNENLMFILSIIFIGLIVASHWCLEVSFDSIVQTGGTLFGAAAGASLAGKYAVDAVKKQIENEKINKTEDLIKEVLNFTTLSQTCINESERILKIADRQEIDYESIQSIQIHISIINDCITEMNRIDEKLISLDIFTDYKAARSMVSSLPSISSQFLTTKSKEHRFELVSTFKQVLISLRNLLDEIDAYTTEQYSKLQ